MKEILQKLRDTKDWDGMPFFRCTMCGKVINLWDLAEGKGCTKCGNSHCRPTNLGIIEMIVQMWKHPRIWEWQDKFNKFISQDSMMHHKGEVPHESQG